MPPQRTESGIMLIRKYQPRRATVEEVRRFFLQNYCNATDALSGTARGIETALNQEAPGCFAQAAKPNH